MKMKFDNNILDKLEWIKWDPKSTRDIPAEGFLYWVVVEDSTTYRYVCIALYNNNFFTIGKFTESDINSEDFNVSTQKLDNSKVKYYSYYTVDDIEPELPEVEEIEVTLTLIKNTRENRKNLEGGWYNIMDSEGCFRVCYYNKEEDRFYIDALFFSKERIK